MSTVAEIVKVLERHVNDEYFVVDVKAAMKELDNPQLDFKNVLDDLKVAEWHFYALEGLRSIAGKDTISSDVGRAIIDGTKMVAQQLGIDEFYKTFNALAGRRDNASFLADFVSDLIKWHDQRDWLWLAFSAMATLLQRQPDAVTDKLAGELEQAYDKEPTTLRRKPMDEILQILRQRQLTTIRLAERGTWLGDRLWVREVRKLTEWSSNRSAFH